MSGTPEQAVVPQEDHNVLRRTVLLRWSFPILGLLVTLGSQILLPRILQVHLSPTGYVTFVTVSSVVSYLSLVDGGLSVSILRQLSVLHAAGDRSGFAGELTRARRIFTVIGLAGAALAGTAMLATLVFAPHDHESSSWTFRLVALSLVVSNALLLATGSLHTVLVFATGRLLLGQLVALLSTSLPTAALIVAAMAFKNLTAAIAAMSCVTGLVALWRAAHASRLWAHEIADTPCKPPTTPLRALLLSGIAVKAAEALPTAAFPHLLTLQAPQVVPVAIPARTLANACRLVPQQFVNLLQVHITRRWASDQAERTRGEKEIAVSSSLLCAIQLAAVAFVWMTATRIFATWLPMQSGSVTSFLPGLLVEQALVSATLPSGVLFMASGRLGYFGLIRLIGIGTGLLTLAVAVPIAPRIALGLALAVSALPLFVVGWSFEISTLRRPFLRPVSSRYLAGLAAATTSIVLASRPLAAGLVILTIAVVLGIPAVTRLILMLRTPWSARATTDDA